MRPSGRSCLTTKEAWTTSSVQTLPNRRPRLTHSCEWRHWDPVQTLPNRRPRLTNDAVHARAAFVQTLPKDDPVSPL